MGWAVPPSRSPSPWASTAAAETDSETPSEADLAVVMDLGTATGTATGMVALGMVSGMGMEGLEAAFLVLATLEMDFLTTDLEADFRMDSVDSGAELGEVRLEGLADLACLRLMASNILKFGSRHKAVESKFSILPKGSTCSLQPAGLVRELCAPQSFYFRFRL